jgi:hypothetical protein
MGFAFVLAMGCTGRNPAFDPPANATTGPDAGNETAPVTPPVPDAGKPAPETSPAEDLAAPADAAPPASETGAPAPDVAEAPDTPSMPDAAVEVARDLAPEVVPVANICPADSDLVLCVDFEGGVFDRSLHKHDIRADGGMFVKGARPEDGSAGDFNSTTRMRIQHSDAMDVKALTIEATVTPRRLPASGDRMGILDYTHEYSLFIYPDGKVRCIVVTGDGVPELESPAGMVTEGVPAHVACTVSATTITLWKNGVQVGPSKSIDEPLETGPGSDTMVIGGNFSDDEPDPFDGFIDNLRIWRTARTGTGCAGGLSCP